MREKDTMDRLLDIIDTDSINDGNKESVFVGSEVTVKVIGDRETQLQVTLGVKPEEHYVSSVEINRFAVLIIIQVELDMQAIFIFKHPSPRVGLDKAHAVVL